MAEKLSKWFGFGVLVALAPLAVRMIDVIGSPAWLPPVIGRGELIIVACGLCAAAIGDLISASRGSVPLRILTGALTALLLLTSSIYYGSVSEGLRPAEEVAWFSLWIYGFSVVTCAGAVAVSD